MLRIFGKLAELNAVYIFAGQLFEIFSSGLAVQPRESPGGGGTSPFGLRWPLGVFVPPCKTQRFAPHEKIL